MAVRTEHRAASRPDHAADTRGREGPMSWFYEKTAPRTVKDGIRSQSGKVGQAASWWGRRWLEALSELGWDNRLARGRSYARRGQVTNLEISAGGITAKVQGSQPTPYQ